LHLNKFGRDTVSSIGMIRAPTLPETSSGMNHVGTFRHALALDERRVKFLPEFAHGGAGPQPRGQATAAEPPDILETNVDKEQRKRFSNALRFLKRPIKSCFQDVGRGAGIKLQHIEDQAGDIKEVWFAGSHSDM
jgi:uncharacterized protein (DUF2235 family)